MTESRESINNWCDSAQNWFARDDGFMFCVQPGQTWNPAHAGGNFGLAAEGPDTKLRRTAPQMSAALQRFFMAVSGFFPFNFLKRRFPRSTSWVDMINMVYAAYNLQLNGSSLLRYGDLQRFPDESYHIYYERLHDYFFQHLEGADVQVAGYATGAHGDEMTLSHANLIVVLWLEKIDKRLLKLV